MAQTEHPLCPLRPGQIDLPNGKGRARAARAMSVRAILRKIGFVLVGVAALALAAAMPAAAGSWSAAKAVEADEIVARFLSTLNASDSDLPEVALSLAVGQDGTLLLAKGYGEAAPGIQATAHTIYHVGSIAKQFTAAAVLDLIARDARLRGGKPLDLDLPLTEVFDGVEHWAAAGRNKRAVTLRSLLTMTSNLPNFTRRPPPETNPWGRIGAPELLSRVKKMRQWGSPNSFEYSNTSYFLLAEVMEQAVLPGEQQPREYRDYLRSLLFRRAGLVETGFIGDYPEASIVALPVGRRMPVFDQPNWLKGSADMASSATDLFVWNTALMEGRVIPPEYAALMTSGTGRVSPEIYYGMGWFVEYRPKQNVFSHAGIVPGYTSMNMIAAASGGSRSWTSVTLLVNTDVASDGLDYLAKELMRLAQR